MMVVVQQNITLNSAAMAIIACLKVKQRSLVKMKIARLKLLSQLVFA